MKLRRKGAYMSKLFTCFSLIACLFAVSFTAKYSNKYTKAYAEGTTDTITPFNILCICSYNYSYETVPQHIEGLEKGLGNLSYEITFENMDTKRYYDAEDIIEFHDYLAYKMEKIDAKYDLIFLIDDSALRFGVNYRDELFGDTPIVFMGINSISDATTSSALPNVTGIAETLDFESNYELMRSLFPERDEIVLLCDGSNTSAGEYVEFLKFTDNHPEISYTVLNASYYTQKGLKRALNELDEHQIIYYLDFSQDGDGNHYTIKSAATFIHENTDHIPVIRPAMANCTDYILGGISYSYTDAGEVAGKMAAKILNGVDADNLPFVSETITESYFYQDALDEFGISTAKLPYDSTIADEHFNLIRYYEENALILNLIFLIIILLFVIIAIQARFNRQHERMLNNDNLTQIPNRHYINQRIQQLSSTFTPYGLGMIDVDHFKYINDTFGHLMGDSVLKEVAERLRSITNKNITFARIGGDEFMVLITGPEIDNVVGICDQIRKAFELPITIDKQKIQITLSMGYAMYPSDINDPTQIMALADRALYYIKENGRNNYKLFSDL